MKNVIDALLKSAERSIRFKVLVNVRGKSLQSAEIKRLQKEIQSSPRVMTLLSERDANGMIPASPYAKWYGAHWVLTSLADIGYPSGDKSLIPLREQIYGWLFSEDYAKYLKPIHGRSRLHASIDGNAIYSTLKLGIADERVEQLVARLLEAQWSDGGWNCDRDARGDVSSFTETLIPLRALALHAQLTGRSKSRTAAKRAAEVFLTRHLYRRLRGGNVIRSDFTRLRYPNYWHYDILFGLKVLAEAGLIRDRRCNQALEVLESKQLPDGGWAAHGKYYQATTRKIPSGRSLVTWGPAGATQMNEFVTADALHVLKAAGRLKG